MKWVNVKNRLPENNQEILVYSISLERKCGKKLSPLACYYYNGFKTYNDKESQKWLDSVEITHWMPLPKPPLINPQSK